tara:strand:+ start:604 stop:777 length:174 start_codon:yes stop_codon:yes gene_type:complete
MGKKIKLEITKAQFLAVIDMAETINSLIGTGEDFGKEQNKNLLLFNRMMEANGYKRT